MDPEPDHDENATELTKEQAQQLHDEIAETEDAVTRREAFEFALYESGSGDVGEEIGDETGPDST